MMTFREFMGNQPPQDQPPQDQPAQQHQPQQDRPQQDRPPQDRPPQDQPAQYRPRLWRASKDEVLSFWKNLRPDQPIPIRPIAHQHVGSTFGEDGIRLTGSPQFIASTLARLKEFMNFETPAINLEVSYRETESTSKSAMSGRKSYVFYIQTKQRVPN